jgi:hypothetical protein
MDNDSYDINLENLLLQIIGQKVYKSDISIGSMVFFILDPDYLVQKKIPYGNQHINLYLCMWRIETDDKILVASEDNKECIAKGIEYLVGKSITSFEIAHPSMDATIIFDNKIILKTFAVTCDETKELWSIRYSDDNHLSVFINNNWTYGK